MGFGHDLDKVAIAPLNFYTSERFLRLMVKSIQYKLVLLVFSLTVFSPGHAVETPPKKYEFTQDWTTPHTKTWADLLVHLKSKPNVNYLEIGVFEGRSLIWMLDNILTHPSARATIIDTFGDGTKQRYLTNLKHSGYAKRVTTVIGNSQKKLRELPLSHFDILYIDGSHLASDVLSDAVQGWEVVKVGGIIVFDDYMFKADYLKDQPPQLAIDAFLSVFGKKVEVLHKNYQLAVRKVAL